MTKTERMEMVLSGLAEKLAQFEGERQDSPGDRTAETIAWTAEWVIEGLPFDERDEVKRLANVKLAARGKKELS